MNDYLLHLLCGITALLTAALLAGVFLRRRSASLRHSVFATGMLGVLFVPLLLPLLPHRSLGVLPMQRSKSVESIPVPVDFSSDNIMTDRETIFAEHGPVMPSDLAGPATISDRRLNGGLDIVGILMTVWAVGVGLLLLRFVSSIRAASKIVTKTIPLDEPAFEAMAKRLGIKRFVELRQSEVGVVPFTVGIHRPVVVLPESSRHWTVEERRAVLTHELGHVARRDVFWQFLAEFCCAVYWFHPLAWLAARQLRIEREIACDDLVVLAGEEPPVYASILLQLASGLKNRDSRRHLLGCTVAMARHHEVRRRITSILDTTLLRKPLGRLGSLLLLLVAAVGVILASTLSPTGKAESPNVEDEIIMKESPVFATPVSVDAWQSDEPVSYYYSIFVGMAEKGVDAKSLIKMIAEKIPEDSAFSSDKIDEILRELGKEKKLTILSRPQIRAVENEPAFIALGSERSRMLVVHVLPRKRGDSVLTEISLKKTVDVGENETNTLQWETLAEMQEGKPLLVSGLLGSQEFIFLASMRHHVPAPSEPPLPNTYIMGRLVDEAGKPVTGIEIRIQPSISHYKHWEKTDEDGRFRFSCSEKGKLQIRPYADDYAGRTVTVEKRGDIGDIVLRRGIRPTVRVLDLDGNPVPNINVTLWQNNTPLEEYREGRTDAEGRFTFQPVMPDESFPYLITAQTTSDEQAGGLRKDVSDPRPRAAFVNKLVKILADTKEFELRPVEVVSVTIRMPGKVDDRNRPWFNRGPNSDPPPFDEFGYWGSGQWKPLGNDVYRVDTIPRGLPIVLMYRPDTDLAYRLTVNGREPARPIVFGGAEVGALDVDSEITVTGHEPTPVSVRLVDENGDAATAWVGGYYPGEPKPYSLEFVDGEPRIREEFLSSIRSTEETGARLSGFLHFDFKLDEKTGSYRSVGMAPDRKTMIIAFDRGGRIGYVNTRGKAGEEQEFIITLKKVPEPTATKSDANGAGKPGTAHATPDKNVTVNENPFDVKQYPVKFAEHVAKVENEVRANNGMALFVRVTDSDDNPIRRVDYHVSSRCGDMGNFACTTTDGWFGTFNLIRPSWQAAIKSRGLPDMYKNVEFYIYTATNRPTTIRLPVTPGKIYYADVTLEKTPETELTSVSGTVLDEDDKPMENVSVHLRVVGGVGATSGLKQTNTDKDGLFTFDKVTPQPYQFALSKQGYPYTQLPEIPVNELKSEHIYRYCKNREIEIEYVYQSDGSRDFNKGDLQPRTVTLSSDFSRGFRFETGEMTNGARDIDYRQKNDVLEFAQVYFRNDNGFYDAGEVPFESVTEADDNAKAYPNVGETGYQKPRPVELGHVYVVRTTDDKYAKFVVRKITAK